MAALKFAVIGHPVAHSLSPRMHAANFRTCGLDAMYGAVDVEPGTVPAALARFQAEGYRGINVTVPHKIAVRDCMTRLDATAVRAGAVNTVRFEADGTMSGFNTDMAGFLQPLVARGFPFEKAAIVLLGAGGAARAVAAACLDAGCKALVWANRTPAKAQALAETFADARISTRALDALVADAALLGGEAVLIVNATTLGLKPDDPPALPADAFRPNQLVYDLIPIARETATLAAARAAGAGTLDGRGMLAAQAAESFRIWTGLAPDLPAMRAALE